MAARFVDLPAGAFLDASERATFIRMRVFDQPVDLAAFVSFWQVLGDRKTFRITEE